MNKFSPLTFLDLAKELQTGSSENYWRTSIGRAYYAVYGFVVLNKPNITSQGKNLHEKLINHFKTSRNTSERKIGGKLETLFEQRVNADYDYSKAVFPSYPKFPIQLAEQIINDLKGLGFK